MDVAMMEKLLADLRTRETCYLDPVEPHPDDPRALMITLDERDALFAYIDNLEDTISALKAVLVWPQQRQV